jgi:hypothetical protein
MAILIPTLWQGSYAYDAEYIFEIERPPVMFTMIWQFGWFGRFFGSVNDSHESAMPETGKINGRFKNNVVNFTKQMPIETYLNSVGEIVRTNRRHPPIYYHGSFDPDIRELVGGWYIVPKRDTVTGFEYPGCKGTWNAKPLKS